MNERTSGKQKNLTAIIVIVAVLVVILAVGWYLASSYLAKKTADVVTNEILDQTGVEVSTTTAKWPTDFAIAIPEYTKGTVKGVAKLETPKTWDIIIGNTTKADYENYVAQVKAAGWTQEAEGAMIADYTHFKKEGWDFTVVFDASSNGAKVTLVEAVK